MVQDAPKKSPLIIYISFIKTFSNMKTAVQSGADRASANQILAYQLVFFIAWVAAVFPRPRTFDCNEVQ